MVHLSGGVGRAGLNNPAKYKDHYSNRFAVFATFDFLMEQAKLVGPRRLLRELKPILKKRAKDLRCI